jgi:predicted patatin/cPLA2 family phospholipase
MGTERARCSRPALAALMLGALLTSGCAASLRPREAVPEADVNLATLPGYPRVRYSLDGESDDDELFYRDYSAAMVPAHGGDVALLAISGGGANGAYGAGLLCGWTESGGRPEFRVVTGVSTGALIAPFAFLGPAYDDRLRKAYTTLSDDDIFEPRNIFGIIRGDSILETSPLHETLVRFVDEDMLRAIAEAHRGGRRLFVGTTDMDTQQPVAWDMGAIAASGNPDAIELFRRILVASASIPVAFPPQYFEVEANGARYTEMHMDGGVTNQVFLRLDVARIGTATTRSHGIKAYIIRNGKLSPEYGAVPPRILPILMKTLHTLVKTQGEGDIFRIYDETVAAGAEFFLASEPVELNPPHEHMFEPSAMSILFTAAFDAARNGSPWARTPPGWRAED